MTIDVKKLFQKIKPSLMPERLISRAVASWFAVTVVRSFGKGIFTDIGSGQESRLLLTLLWTAAFFVVFTLVGMTLPKFHTDSWFLFTAAAICVVKWLLKFGYPVETFGLDYGGDVNRATFVLAVMLSSVMVAVYFVKKNKALADKIKPGRISGLVIVCIFGIGFGALLIRFSYLRYATYSAPNFDFGIFSQMFHYMKETGLPLVTCERDVLLSHFAVHVSPAFYLLLPVYCIFPTAATLQVSQAVLLFSGIIPLWLICRQLKTGNKTAVIVCFIYAAYPAISCGCLYDFHENCFIVPFLLWMFFFFEKEKWIPMYVFAVLVLSVKEDAAVYIVIFALYAIIARKKILHGSILAVSAVAWFIAATAYLDSTSAYWAEYFRSAGMTPNPRIRGAMTGRYGNLMVSDEDGLAGAIKTIIQNPGFVLTQLFRTENGNYAKVVYLFEMLFPLGMIPFMTKKPSEWILLSPLLINLLTMYRYQYNIGFQYSFAITAFLFYALARNIRYIGTSPKRYLLASGAAICACLYLVCFVPSVATYNKTWKDGREKFEIISEELEKIPGDASVSVSTSLVAHMSDHDELYELSYHGDETDVDYVIFYYPDNYKATKAAYLEAGYTVERELDNYLLVLKSPG